MLRRSSRSRSRPSAPRDDLVVLESCTTTWAFDTGRKRFARLPKGLTLTSTSAEWRPYASMWFDLGARTLVVSLDEAGTQLLQTDIHNGPCSECGEEAEG